MSISQRKIYFKNEGTSLSFAKNWQIRSGLKAQIGNLWDFGKQPWDITYKGFTIFAGLAL